MKISTTRFGMIEISESDIILMRRGILGFEESKKYALLYQDVKNPFLWFQSLDDGATAFVVIDPFLLQPYYQPELNDDTLEKLEIDNPEDVALMVIVSIRSNPFLLTANLRAPIVINAAKKKASQVVLEDSRFPIRYDILKNRESLLGGNSNLSSDQKDSNKVPCYEIFATGP